MSQYKITGIDRSGHRFKIYSNNYMHAMMINLYSGTVWHNDKGTWRIIKRVY